MVRCQTGLPVEVCRDNRSSCFEFGTRWVVRVWNKKSHLRAATMYECVAHFTLQLLEVREFFLTQCARAYYVPRTAHGRN